MVMLALGVLMILLTVGFAVLAVSESPRPQSPPAAPAWRAVREIQQRAVEAMLASELHAQQGGDDARRS